MMKSLLKEGNPLFGRTDVVLHLKELNYLETSEFYLNKSIYDKIAFYAVFGGSPLINEKINPNLSLKENIINTFLKVDSPVYNYCNNILFTDVPESYNIKALCMLLKNGKRSAVEIENAFNIDKTGNINKKLNTLVEMDLIKKYYPINKMDNHKRAKYEINDNAIRFFYTFVQQNLSLLYVLGEDRFYEEFIENKITTFISHRFEEMVRDYFILAIHKGEYKNIINVGTYYYDDSYKKINGEFDVALALKNGKYEIVEVKYYKTNPLTLKEMSEEEAQIKLIKEINIEKISFISTSGTETQDIYSTIDVDKMYNL